MAKSHLNVWAVGRFGSSIRVHFSSSNALDEREQSFIMNEGEIEPEPIRDNLLAVDVLFSDQVA
jgi:hypothetical protein